MRLRLWHRLFLAFVLLSAATLAGFVAWQQWRFREGFATYLNAVALTRLQAASERLADAFRDHGSWNFLRGDERQFEQLVDPFGRHHGRGGMPGGPAPGQMAGPPPGPGPGPGPDPGPGDGAEPREPPPGEREGPWPPEGPPPHGPPAVWELRNRVLLVDAHDMPVVGGDRLVANATGVPVEVDGKRVGTLYLRPLPRLFGGLDQNFAAAQWHDALLAGLAALVLALLFAFVLARWLLAPVRALAAGMHRLGAGDFEQRIEATSSDELGALASDFNRLAQTLAQHREARRRWGADIAHELRTPLSVLRGEIAALQDGVRQASPAAFDSLQAECTRLAALINDLYELALADAGALEYRFETLDLNLTAQDAVGRHQRLCAEAGLRLEVLLPPTPTWVRGDARRLDQLFDNLLGNARRYTDAPGQVRVGIAQGSTVSRISVEDSAPGVPDDALPRLFDRLYRVEASRSRAAGGAGLGLAICRAIVTAHGGRIDAAHAALGGLRIDVDLPASQEAPP